MGNLSAPEKDRYFDLVTHDEQLPSLPGLRIEIVIRNLGPEADFTKQYNLLAAARATLFLGLLVLELSVIKHTTHRRDSRRCYFNEVETVAFGHFPGLVQGHCSELFPIVPDQTNLSGANLFVDAKFLNYVLTFPLLRN